MYPEIDIEQNAPYFICILYRTDVKLLIWYNRIVPLWNALPLQLRDADSLYYFQHKSGRLYDNLVNDFDTDNCMYLVNGMLVLLCV